MSGLSPPPFSESEARSAVTRDIDYFCGRGIKSNISGDTVNTWGYNRDAGTNAFENIVAKLRGQ
jgi:hypothetical protein